MKPVNAHESETEELPLFTDPVELARARTEPPPGPPVVMAESNPSPIHQSIPYSNLTTSKAAAEEIAPHLVELEGMVLEAIKASADGLTCEQVEEFCALSHQCASARVRGLVLKGMIRDSGRTRKTISGRSAIVWEPVR